MEIKVKLDKLRGVPSYIRRGETVMLKNHFTRENKYKFEIANGSLSVCTNGSTAESALMSPSKNLANMSHHYKNKRHRND